MDNITKNALIERLEETKKLESQLDNLRRQERRVKRLLDSGCAFEISLETELDGTTIFHASVSGSASLQSSDLREVLKVLLCAVSRKFYALKDEYDRL